MWGDRLEDYRIRVLCWCPMMKLTKSLSTGIAILASATMLSVFVPAATAVGQGNSGVASARSFRVQAPRKNLLQESVSTTVDGATRWTLTESKMAVPKTQSPAEKAADEAARAAAQRQAEQAAAAAQQAAAASRSEERQTLGSATNNSVQSAPSPTISGGSDVLSIGRQFIGLPYVWGGTSPTKGFDCSGFVQYVFAQKGIQLPRVDSGQRAWFQAHGKQVSQDQAQPGDFVWTSGHVGLYVGGGIMLDAPAPGQTIGYHSMSWASFEYYHLG